MQFLDECRARYGPTFTVKLLVPGTTVFVSSPDAAKTALAADPSVFTSGEANLIMQPALGERSVVMLDGDEHLDARRRLLHAFHADHIKRHRPVIEEVAARELARWRVGDTFALHPRMEALSFEVIMRTVFGAEEGSRLTSFRDVFLRMMRLTAAKPAFALLMSATPNWDRYSLTFRRYDRRINAFIYEEIARRRADERVGERDDVLSQLIVASEQARGFDDAALRDQLITLLVAGYETTATGLAWAVERLLRQPAVLRVLEDALAAGGEDYLEAVIKETLRVRTLAPVVFRKVKSAPHVVDGHELPVGTIIGVSSHLMHSQAELYPAPDEFRPERFLAARQPDTYMWIPFGGGVRRCIGAAFSLFEMKVVLGSILRHATLSAPDPRNEPPKRLGIIYRPAHGTRVRVDAIKQPSPVPHEAQALL